LDKNLIIGRLEYEVKKTKWDRTKNQYLLKSIKENKSIYPSDEKYLEKLLKLKIIQKPIVQKPETKKVLESFNEKRIKIVPICEINSNIPNLIPSWVKNSAEWGLKEQLTMRYLFKK
jgi:hypothetical protein